MALCMLALHLHTTSLVKAKSRLQLFSETTKSSLVSVLLLALQHTITVVRFNPHSLQEDRLRPSRFTRPVQLQTEPRSPMNLASLIALPLANE